MHTKWLQVKVKFTCGNGGGSRTVRTEKFQDFGKGELGG